MHKYRNCLIRSRLSFRLC